MYGIFNRFNSNLAKGDVSKVENSFNCKSRKEAIKSKRTTIEYRSSRKAEKISAIKLLNIQMMGNL